MLLIELERPVVMAEKQLVLEFECTHMKRYIMPRFPEEIPMEACIQKIEEMARLAHEAFCPRPRTCKGMSTKLVSETPVFNEPQSEKLIN